MRELSDISITRIISFNRNCFLFLIVIGIEIEIWKSFFDMRIPQQTQF